MSSSGRPVLIRLLCAGAVLAAGGPAPVAAQGTTPGTLTAEEALENARDVYYVPREQRVVACPENTVERRAEDGEGVETDVIVVCAQLVPEYQYQTRDGPLPRMDRTANGAPRAPDVSTLPPCGHAPGVGVGTCIKVGSVPPPALMVDVTKFPEPLSREHAARIFRAEDLAPAETEAAGDGTVPSP